MFGYKYKIEHINCDYVTIRKKRKKNNESTW